MFGRFLEQKGIISFETIYEAGMLQKKTNHRIGEISGKKGLAFDVDKILVLQEETMVKFGEVAIKHKFLTAEQVETLVGHQKEEYLFFGAGATETADQKPDGREPEGVQPAGVE